MYNLLSPQEWKYIPIELLVKYLQLLHRRPVPTKSITSAVIAGLGDALYQVLKKQQERHKNSQINWRSISAVAGCGLIVTGPLSHYFYIFLDKAIPPGSKFAAIRRLILDRLIFGPLYLLIILYVRSLLEGLSHRESKRKVLRTYWPILKMSLRVWTVVQYVNVNHVPQQYRVLFINMVSLGWNVYLAAMKQETKK